MSFDENVYAAIREGARSSARIVVPQIIREHARPRGVSQPKDKLTVLDVGAGEGWWSAEFAAQPEVAEVISIDDHANDLTVAGVKVQRLDLEDRALRFDGPFDVVVCLEVAEHVSARAGDELVALLCRSVAPSGVIAWSAAIPGQGGHKHVNEQWPRYWDERFRSHGWRLSDPFRDWLWNYDGVEPWYRQNLLLGVTPSANGTSWAAGGAPRGLVHPEIWAWRMDEIGRPIVPDRKP